MYVLAFQKTFASVVNMEAVRMEMDVCISLPEDIGFLVNMEDVRWRRMHSVGVSENICFSCKYSTLSGWRRIYSIGLSENIISVFETLIKI